MSLGSVRVGTSVRLSLTVLGAAGLLLGGLVAPASVLAASAGSLRVSPATATTSTGGSFTVAVVANANTPVAGAQATLTFDRTLLQVTSVDKAGPWSADDADWAGFPSPANMSSAIAGYNNSGKVAPAIAAFFIGNATNEPANTDLPLFTVTFQVRACGNSSLGIPVGPTGGALLNGTIGNTYGYDVPLTSSAGSVVNPCAGETPSPTQPSAPTSTPGSSSAPFSGITRVSGSLEAGFLGLTVPTSVTMPFVWGATNRAIVLAQVSSNRPWDLAVSDTNTGANEGHMISGSDHLAEAMTARAGGHDRIDLETGGQLMSGGTAAMGIAGYNGVEFVVVELGQFVGGTDQPGSYSIVLLFQATSSF